MIDVRSLSYRDVLHEISVQIPDHGSVGLVGPNGSGKTTLLRCLYGALRPNSGDVVIDGRTHLRGRALARKVAVVDQHFGEPPQMTVAECVSLGRLPHGDSAPDMVADTLARVGMLDKARHPMDRLSGGERQRVMIARALVQDTKYLLLDEPTNNLDIRYQLELFELLAQRHRPAVLVLHDLNQAMRYCDTVVVLGKGRVVAHGAPGEVLTPEVLEPLYQVAVTATPTSLLFERLHS